jgi:hypothetical protein
MATPRRRASPSELALVVLLAALAVGIAAEVVVAARTAGPPPPVGPSQSVILPGWLVGAAAVGVLCLFIVPLVYRRITEGGFAIPGRYIVFCLTIILILIVVVEVAHALGLAQAPGPGSATVSPGGNNSTQSNTTTPAQNLSGNGSTLSQPWLHPPAWLLLVAFVGVAVVIAVVVAPRLFTYMEEREAERRGRRTTAEATRALQRVLVEAGASLAAARDPRSVILALYADLLAQLRVFVSDVEHDTAEEIRALHLVRLGVRPAAAEELTRIFEVARYSTHPIGPAEVERASRAIGTAAEDLRKAMETLA